MKYIDLRSDTVTWPTDEMRKAMFEAEVGDDVFEDDPTVVRLEQYGASLMGKEAALFVPSGTFANQLALFTHCAQGNEVIVNDASHIVQSEAGAASIIAGVQLRTITPKNDYLSTEEIIPKIRVGTNIHHPKTALLWVQNTLSNGKVVPLDVMASYKYLATRHHIPIHLDGARIFNAATALNVSSAEIASNVDTVSFCLSKGLCAPVGSLLAGSKSFIEKARFNRKIMGGGMRQVGILAAAGLVALKQMRNNLQQDHDMAFYLANELLQIPEIEIDITSVETNFVFFSFCNMNVDGEAFQNFFRARGIFVLPPDENGKVRLVTHHWITKESIDTFVSALKEFVQE